MNPGGATAQPHMTKEKTMTNDQLQFDVADELSWDPKIDAEEIAVSAEDGLVTLRGTVGSFRQKREAEAAAGRVWGVVEVDNELQVRILDERRRDDAEVRGDVLQALMLDSLIPTTVDAKVSYGLVTLTGFVDHQYQRDEAVFVATNVLGVVGVDDEVMLSDPAPDPGDVAHAIKKAFERDAKLDAESLSVESSNGTVTLRGTVSSWSERDAAVAAAWASPGARAVDNELSVVY
jgi:osmotically-inducible protein OsmY